MIFCYRQTDRQTLHHNIYIIIVVVQVATGSGLVDEELSALELGRNFHGCMRGLAIGQ